eukprot:SAG22_NODE_717_length_7707_cov_3.098186_1_plen_104_part_10
MVSIGAMLHGWYDAQCSGANNDYCRYVGDSRPYPFVCIMAGDCFDDCHYEGQHPGTRGVDCGIMDATQGGTYGGSDGSTSAPSRAPTAALPGGRVDYIIISTAA